MVQSLRKKEKMGAVLGAIAKGGVYLLTGVLYFLVTIAKLLWKWPIARYLILAIAIGTGLAYGIAEAVRPPGTELLHGTILLAGALTGVGIFVVVGGLYWMFRAKKTNKERNEQRQRLEFTR